MQNAKLKFAKLAGATLDGTDVTGADLSYANLNATDLGLTFLDEANLYDAIYDAKTTWPGSPLYWNNTICPDRTNSNDHPSCGF